MSLDKVRKQEIRKLQVTGGSGNKDKETGTYIISLPKKWIQQMGLKKGSNLSLVKQADNSLVILVSHKADLQQPDSNFVNQILDGIKMMI